MWFLNFKRRLQDPISTHVLYLGFIIMFFFSGTCPWEKTERAPLVRYSHDISPGEKTNTSSGHVDGGLHKSPVRGTKGEKTVKTSSSCVFGRKRRNGHVKDPRYARPGLPPPDSRPDPLCDTTSDTIVLLILLLFNCNNVPDVWGEMGKKTK